MPTHTCQQGDCIGSLAVQYGHLPKTIWEHADNAALKALRKDPDVLLPGDAVFVPEVVPKTLDIGGGATHGFVRKAVPSKLRIVLSIEGEPMANEPYTIVVDGEETAGTTGGDGKVELPIKPDAKGGYLEIQGRRFEFGLGSIDPVTTVGGVQARLNQLGYDAGAVDNLDGPVTQAAVNSFQQANALAENGQWDDAAFRDKLKALYGS